MTSIAFFAVPRPSSPDEPSPQTYTSNFCEGTLLITTFALTFLIGRADSFAFCSSSSFSSSSSFLRFLDVAAGAFAGAAAFFVVESVALAGAFAVAFFVVVAGAFAGALAGAFFVAAAVDLVVAFVAGVVEVDAVAAFLAGAVEVDLVAAFLAGAEEDFFVTGLFLAAANTAERAVTFFEVLGAAVVVDAAAVFTFFAGGSPALEVAWRLDVRVPVGAMISSDNVCREKELMT